MLCQTAFVFEHTGALEHHIDAEISPRQVRRVTFGEGRTQRAVDVQGAVGCAHLAVVTPVDRVVLDQVRQARLSALAISLTATRSSPLAPVREAPTIATVEPLSPGRVATRCPIWNVYTPATARVL